MKIKPPQLILILSLFSVVLWFLYPMADADLGWHLRLGETIRNSGTPRLANTFSSLIPEYIWPNHSWGFDVLISSLFDLGSFPLLSISGSLLIVLAFYLSYRRLKQTPSIISLSVLLFLGSELLNTGLRSQLVSLVLTSLVLLLLERYSHTHKKIFLYVLPGVFLLWANIHGQFIFGLALFSAYVAIPEKSVSKTHPKFPTQLLVALLFSILSTLLNPFGLDLFKTTFEHLNAPTLPYIYEWMPWETNSNRFLVFFAYGVILSYGVYKKRQLFQNKELIIQIILFIAALKARRMIPFFLIVSLPLFDQLLVQSHFINKKRKLWSHLNVFALSILIISLAFLVLPSRNIFTQTWTSYCHTQVLCSEKLVSFLQDNKIQGNIFNAYRLGGHLIYRYPQVKVFIDGRMTVWHEGSWYPFQDYFNLIHTGPGFQNLLLRYPFKYYILHPQFELAQYLEHNLHWPVIFQDETIKVFQNPQASNTAFPDTP